MQFLKIKTTGHGHVGMAHNRLLINTLSLKLWWPITIIFCVPCTTMLKHVTSSLWMNTSNLIFWQLCIYSSLPLCSRYIGICIFYFWTSNSMYLYGLNLFTLTNTGLISNFSIVNNNTILFGNTYYTMYGPNHFLN